ncbi:gene transfer agent family protein [Mesorhizobium sp. B2-4-8]|uniref:gene transfer agent family protein n=1 Tax=Mesorhizobium sp. B2-4-8 TaxID=2589941 RepID=UPI001125D6E6|nr:gene transfer agent family protein [Mesorhizobium sp. B2-4-8]TPL39236.1 gene transfer agent family protein [Mesorhizobium sp. B2-4-8]
MPTAIIARVNGADMTFCIHREDLTHFEARFGGAYALYKRIAAGAWKTSDLLDILRFASGPRPTGDPMFAHLDTAILKLRGGGKACPIESALLANGPAIYAPLVLQVLAAALFQLKPNELAFTDEVVDVGA